MGNIKAWKYNNYLAPNVRFIANIQHPISMGCDEGYTCPNALKKMSEVAIDIALMLPEPVVATAVEINSRLQGLDSGALTLDGLDYLPHITLCMAVVERQQLAAIEKAVWAVVSKSKPIRLIETGFDARPNSGGGFTSSIAIKRTTELMRMHNALMACISEFDLTETAILTANHIDPSTPPSEASLHYIANFRNNASGNQFDPHITIGYGTAQREGKPLEAMATEVAAFQLANNCTCRRANEHFSLTFGN